MKVSVLIPARNEPYLDSTILDVKGAARGDIEVLTVLNDGVPDMRGSINAAVKQSTGDFLFKLDAHCMVDEGFDVKLIAAHKPNLVQVPRRKRLDPEKWVVIEDGRPSIDNEYIIFQNLLTKTPNLTSKGFIWGSPWETDNEHLMHFQGSCWFMAKDWFNQCGFMDKAYGSFAQESEEILFTTIKNGGEVKVNKNTWYAHLHKTKEQRAKLNLNAEEFSRGLAYSYNKWITPEFFIPFVERFMPVPTFPQNWKELLWYYKDNERNRII